MIQGRKMQIEKREGYELQFCDGDDNRLPMASRSHGSLEKSRTSYVFRSQSRSSNILKNSVVNEGLVMFWRIP